MMRRRNFFSIAKAGPLAFKLQLVQRWRSAAAWTPAAAPLPKRHQENPENLFTILDFKIPFA
jgi:hypothetical protein